MRRSDDLVEEAAAHGSVSVVGTDAPVGADAASRARRRALRERANASERRRLVSGIVATLAGGSFWGFSGTCASYLFDTYQVDTLWLMCTRQLCAGVLFLAVILATDRERFIRLWTTPRDRLTVLVFSALGVALNQFGYLMTVRLTNAGTATVMQTLQLVLIMGYACLAGRRAPRPREVAGVAFALGGTFLIATGGSLDALAIPPEGLLMGLVAALGAACMSVIPARILPTYGSPIVTGSGMLVSGLVSCAILQPWTNVPALDATGWGAFGVFVGVGSFLAYLLYMQGVKDIGSLRASLIGTIEPVSATVTSFLMLGTLFAPTDIAGFALIIVMVFLTV